MNPSEFHQIRRFANTPFGRIAWVERGAGPAALFLHALPLCGYQWREVMEDLSPVRRCLAPDLMGMGYSEVAPRQDLSFAEQARMLAAFLDAVGVDQVDLSGNDTGGGVSQVFVAMYPARVRTLTLTNCEVHDCWPNQMLTQFYQGVESGLFMQSMKAMLEKVELARGTLAIAYENTQTVTPEMVRLYFEPVVTGENRAAQLGQFAQWSRNRDQMVAMAPRLKESKIPSQVVWGDADTAFDMETSLRWLRSNLGGLEKVTVIPRAKLFFPEEHPRLMSVMLREFWDRVV
jgi:pimeloyl-ACP methyl ester carboxylesterase